MNRDDVLKQHEIEDFIFLEPIPSEPESEDDLEENFNLENTTTISSPSLSIHELPDQTHFEHDYYQLYDIQLDQLEMNMDIPEQESLASTPSVSSLVFQQSHASTPPSLDSVSPSEPSTSKSYRTYSNTKKNSNGKTLTKFKKCPPSHDPISKTINKNNELPVSNPKNKRRGHQTQINKAPKFGPEQRPKPSWSKEDENIPTTSGIVEGQVGVSDFISSLDDKSPVKLFKSIITDEMIEDIAFQTNLYAQQSGKRFVPTNKEEIEAFLGINLLMGIKRLPSYRDYWSSEIDLHDHFISNIMPVNRFGWLLGNLHLNDNSLLPDRKHPTYDKLYKVRPFLDSIAANIKRNFHPGQILAVDESMIKFKGRSSLKQYMPKKPIKRGYKLWVLADKSGYVVEFEIYTGKCGDIRQYDLGPTVVRRLTENLAGRNYNVYIDNYFVSYFLMEDLKDKQINACGTVLIDRKNLPTFQETKSMVRGDSEWFVSNMNIVAIKWIDNKAVHVLSNFHDPREVINVKRREKDGSRITLSCPAAISDYNQHMNCVDKFDQLKSTYEIDRKSHKWWHRIFFYFVDLAVVNSFILHNCLPVTRLDLKTFRRHIVFGLVGERYTQGVANGPNDTPLQISRKKPHISKEIRQTGSSHQPVRGTRRRCAVCSSKQKQVSTFWLCLVCKVPLCLSKNKNCFQRFHTNN